MVINQQTQKLNVLDTMMKYAGLDYSNAQSKYQNDFSNVISMTNLVSGLEDKAKTQIQLVYNNQYYTAVTGFNRATDTLTLSAKSLTQLNKFLTEVLASIKNQQ